MRRTFLLPGLIGARRGHTLPIAFGIRIGRNDPCPCKSGKKFKDCCKVENKMLTIRKTPAASQG